MSRLSIPSPIFSGLAYFSMFFGSGNLVFPLFLGTIAHDSWFLVAIAFLLSGVLGPFIGTLAMVKFEGNTDLFFSRIGKYPSLIFVSILMVVWFPIGAGPRCIQIAYEALARYVPSTPLGFFAGLYTLIVFYVIHHRSRILTILGYYLSPALLVFLGVLWIMGFQAGEAPTQSPSLSSGELFKEGLLHGYSTMDLIASFFFSSTLIHLLQRYKSPRQTTMQNALWSGIIGMGTLAIVYTGLIHMAACNADKLSEIPKQQILPYVSEVFLGKQWSIVPVAIIILACLTTSVAMTTAFSEFLRDKWLGEKYWKICLWISLLSTLLFSFVELQQLIEMTGPVLQIGCPALILLTLYNFYRPPSDEKILSRWTTSQKESP